MQPLLHSGADCVGQIQMATHIVKGIHPDPKVNGLTKEEEQLDWLGRQGGKRGFSLNSCLRLGNERIQTRQGKMGRRITLQTVLFEGILEASEVTHLQAAVRFGLGHGKAMGLGLLSLARIA